MLPVRIKTLVPNLVTARLPPPLPEVSVMLSAMVKLLPLAFVVSNAIVEAASNPPALEPFAPPKLLSRVVTLLVLNSLVPPTLKARTAPEATRIFEANQLAFEPL